MSEEQQLQLLRTYLFIKKKSQISYCEDLISEQCLGVLSVPVPI